MRRIINLMASLYPSLRYGSWTIMLILMFSLSSCFKLYYQTNSVSKTDAESLEQFRLQDKHFIVHSSGSFFELKNPRLTGETFSGEWDSLNPKYDNFLNPVGEKAIPVRRRDKNRCFNEVHLYTPDSVNGKDPVHLLISQINRVDVYSPDSKATKDSRVSSIVGITIAATALVGLGYYISSSITF